jgi:hypothetical protein
MIHAVILTFCKNLDQITEINATNPHKCKRGKSTSPQGDMEVSGADFS